MIDDEEKIKVMKNKRKKIRRKENFVIITAVFLALFVFLGGKYALSVFYQNKNQTQNKTNQTEQKNTLSVIPGATPSSKVKNTIFFPVYSFLLII